MSYRRGPRDRQHDGATVQQPCDRHLRDRGAMALRDCVQLSASSSQASGCHREPWYEGQLVFFAILQHILMLPVTQVVQVLHADDLDHFAGSVNLGWLYLTETNMADLALLLQLGDYAQRFFNGHLGINAVQLPEADNFRLEKTETHLDLLGQVLRPANR